MATMSSSHNSAMDNTSWLKLAMMMSIHRQTNCTLLRKSLWLEKSDLLKSEYL